MDVSNSTKLRVVITKTVVAIVVVFAVEIVGVDIKVGVVAFS